MNPLIMIHCWYRKYLSLVFDRALDENNKIILKIIPKVFATKASLECWRGFLWWLISRELRRLMPHSTMDSELDSLLGGRERAWWDGDNKVIYKHPHHFPSLPFLPPDCSPTRTPPECWDCGHQRRGAESCLDLPCPHTQPRTGNPSEYRY